jgi:hypothetical protein
MKAELLKNLNEGDWFTIVSDGVKNIYKLISKELEPRIAGAECNDVLYEINTNTKVEKINGFQLYLLQGGRDWD